MFKEEEKRNVSDVVWVGRKEQRAESEGREEVESGGNCNWAACK